MEFRSYIESDDDFVIKLDGKTIEVPMNGGKPKGLGLENRAAADAWVRDVYGQGPRNPFNEREVIINNEAAVEVRALAGQAWLQSIRALERRQGAGGRAMLRLCAIADKHHVAMHLDPKPFGKFPDAMKQGRLEKFYQKYGFVKQREGYMTRNPS
jgi:hypothetical protein